MFLSVLEMVLGNLQALKRPPWTPRSLNKCLVGPRGREEPDWNRGSFFLSRAGGSIRQQQLFFSQTPFPHLCIELGTSTVLQGQLKYFSFRGMTWCLIN